MMYIHVGFFNLERLPCMDNSDIQKHLYKKLKKIRKFSSKTETFEKEIEVQNSSSFRRRRRGTFFF